MISAIGSKTTLLDELIREGIHPTYIGCEECEDEEHTYYFEEAAKLNSLVFEDGIFPCSDDWFSISRACERVELERAVLESDDSKLSALLAKIAQKSTLAELYFQYPAFRKFSKLAAILKTSDRLHSLTVSLFPAQKIEDRDVAEIATLLELPTIRQLIAFNIRLTPIGGNAALISRLAFSLMISPSITSLSLTYCKLGAKDIQCLVPGLLRIRHLDLSGNPLLAEGLRYVAKVTTDNKVLEKLCLSNVLGRAFFSEANDVEAACAIASIFKASTSLSSVDLDQSFLTPEESEIISQSLYANRSVRRVKLSFSERISVQDGLSLINVLMNKNKILVVLVNFSRMSSSESNLYQRYQQSILDRQKSHFIERAPFMAMVATVATFRRSHQAELTKKFLNPIQQIAQLASINECNLTDEDLRRESDEKESVVTAFTLKAKQEIESDRFSSAILQFTKTRTFQNEVRQVRNEVRQIHIEFNSRPRSMDSMLQKRKLED